jgi:hypothetical protein
MFPKAPQNHSQERRGINAVATAATELGLIWRETNQADVGIDGQLEFVDTQGFATGRTVAVQIKSGPSFFKHEDAAGYRFYPEKKHRAYWERYPLPVLLILHDPDQCRSYWTDVRQALRYSGTSSNAAISVPKRNEIQSATAAQLFETAGVQEGIFIEDLKTVLIALIEHRSLNGSFPISYFDLFTQGLTNICRSVYFGMDLALVVAESNLSLNGSKLGVGLGETDQVFLFDFVKFLVAQHLADVDFADCLIDWVDRQMQPQFVAPLTTRGRNLIGTINQGEEQMVAEGFLPEGQGLRIAQEGFFEMNEASFLKRLPRIALFQEAYRRS